MILGPAGGRAVPPTPSLGFPALQLRPQQLKKQHLCVFRLLQWHIMSLVVIIYQFLRF